MTLTVMATDTQSRHQETLDRRILSQPGKRGDLLSLGKITMGRTPTQELNQKGRPVPPKMITVRGKEGL